MATGYSRGKPDAQWWMAQVRSGIEHRNKLLHSSRWSEWRNYYRGNFATGILPDNIFFKMIRTMVPRIYFRNPQVSITPRKGQQGQLDYALLAMILERLDNTLIDQMRLKRTMKRSVQDALMFNTGILKLGYGAEFTPTPDPVENTEAPTTDKNMRVEYNSLIQPDKPWVLRVPTGNFILQPGAPDFESARWCAMRVRRHIDDLREDSRFRHVSDMGPGVMTVPGEISPQKLEGMVDLFEIRDKKTTKVFVIAPYSTERVLFCEDDDLQFDNRLNFFPIQFNNDDEYFWGVSDAWIMEPHQKELNAIRTMMQKHRRASVVKWLVKEGALNADQLAKLNSDEVNAAVIVDKDNNLSDVKEQAASDIPAGLMKMSVEEDQMVQEILGMGVNQFGEYAPGSSDRSATEATIVNQSSQIRTDERRDAVADVLTDLIEHMNHIILQKWDNNEQVVDLIGERGAALWVQFKGNELKGLSYDVRIDPDSSVPDTKQIREQKAAGIYKTFGQDPAVDHMKLVRFVLSEIGGPPLTDLMANPAAPQMGAPGAPGSTPNNPMNIQQLIQEVASRAQGKGR